MIDADMASGFIKVFYPDEYRKSEFNRFKMYKFNKDNFHMPDLINNQPYLISEFREFPNPVVCPIIRTKMGHELNFSGKTYMHGKNHDQNIYAALRMTNFILDEEVLGKNFHNREDASSFINKMIITNSPINYIIEKLYTDNNSNNIKLQNSFNMHMLLMKNLTTDACKTVLLNNITEFINLHYINNHINICNNDSNKRVNLYVINLTKPLIEFMNNITIIDNSSDPDHVKYITTKDVSNINMLNKFNTLTNELMSEYVNNISFISTTYYPPNNRTNYYYNKMSVLHHKIDLLITYIKNDIYYLQVENGDVTSSSPRAYTHLQSEYKNPFSINHYGNVYLNYNTYWNDLYESIQECIATYVPLQRIIDVTKQKINCVINKSLYDNITNKLATGESTPFCGICIEPISSSTVCSIYNCNHLFCTECIGGWAHHCSGGQLNRCITCPMCRVNITKVSVVNDSESKYITNKYIVYKIK
jgi:hypothetical protein